MEILVVDDDPRLAQTLVEIVGSADHRWTTVEDSQRGLDAALTHDFDLVVLEPVTPGMSGSVFLTRLRRRSDVPVLVVSSRATRADRAISLQLGADAHLAKPVDPLDLGAQVHTLLRRRRGPRDDSGPLSVGDLTLYPSGYHVTAAGEPVHLTGMEFDLLSLMMRRAGNPVTRDDFARLAHGRGASARERALDTHVRNLRRKLGHDRIRTRRGTGYVLRDTSDGLPRRES